MFARRVAAYFACCIALACGPEPVGETTAGSTGVVTGESGGGPGPTTGEASDSGTTVGTTGDVHACESPVPILQALGEPAAPSGFVRCANEAIHRAEAVACAVPITPTSCTDNSAGGCSVDGDCTDAPFGSCQQGSKLFDPDRCVCIYGCRSDADCGSDQICRCAGEGLGRYTECISADCASGADCDGGWCVLSPAACEPGGYQVACLTPADECFGTDDCEWYSCITYNAEWHCEQQLCG